MAKSKQIGAVIGLDGEAKYKQSIANVVAETKKLDAEAKLLEATFAGQKNTLSALEAQHKNLSQALDTQKRKVTETEKALQHARDDQKRFNDEMEAAKSALEKAEKALDQMRKSGKASAEETDKQQEEVDRLSATIKNSEKNYTTAQNRVTKWETALAKANTEVQETSRELDKNNRYLDEARSSADHCATSIDNMGREVKDAAKDIDKIGDEAKETAEDLDDAGKKSDTFLGNLKANVAGDLISGGLQRIGDAAKEAAEYVVDVGSSFEAAMSEVQAISGASGSDFDAMSEKAQELGASTKFTATEVANAFKYMSLAGWKTSDMLSGIDGVLSLAAASGMELAQASDMVTDYLSAFGMKASESIKIADMLAFAQANSNTTAEQLGEAYGNCAANMHAAGQDIETTTSFLEAFANQGIKGSEAGTKMSAIMRDITAKMKDGKIAIGNTNVEVTDANGNFRDLTDIMTDVEAATQGMGDAERAAALSATFTSRSVGGLNMILTEGMENVSGYETALRNAGGAADEAATIMQDNLSGDLTKMNSALEGLGIAAFDYVDGPLRGVVQGVTGVISGITDVITPQEEELSAFSQYVEDVSTEIQETNEATKKAVEEAKGSFDAATMDSDAIGVLGDRLMELNNVEQLTTTQKAEMQAIVSKLSETIPELSGAYDDENGKLNKTNEELAALVKNYQNAAIAQAATAATQELVNAQMEATVNKVKAESLRDMLENEIAVWDAEAKLYQSMVDSGDYSNDNYRTEALKLWKEALDEGRISLDQYNEAVDDINTSNMDQRMSTMESKVGDLTDGIEEQNLAIQDSEKVIKDCGEEIGVVTEAQSKMASEAAAATSKVSGLSEAMGRGMPTDVAEKMTGVLSDVSDAYVETAETAEDAADTEEDAAERVADAAKAGSDAQKEALKGVRDEFGALRDEIQQATDSKISLFDAFDGGEEMSLDDMHANMESYADGIRQYYEDLETLSKDVGSGISQEFFQYLSDLGPEGANVIHEITEAWTSGSEEDRKKIQDMMYDQLQALDASEQGAEIQARNQTLINEAFNVDPPDPAQYDGLYDSLKDAIQSGGAEVTESAETAFSGAVEAARRVGADIPEGIEQSISDGNIDAAINALNGSIQGKLEGLAEIARDAGVQITPEIAAGIESGDTGAMAAAYDQLISSISENVDTSTLSKVIGDAAGEAAPEIEGHSGEVSDAMGSVAQAGADAAGEKQSAYQTAGDDAGTTYAAALRAHQQEVAQAAGALASAAQNAIMSYRNAFENAGYNMSAGVASGISNGASSAINAARNMAAQTLAAAKAELDIHSPSKKFRQQVGQNISESTAFGIKDKASLAGNEADKMSAQVYDKATAWLSKYKKSHDVSAKDEKYYWKQVLQHVKEGADAYNNVVKKISSSSSSVSRQTGDFFGAALQEVANNFGVSRKTTTGSGKKKKTVNKDAETYYGEVYSAASKYLSNMKVLNDMSLQQELSYWQAVQGQLQLGTQAWYDATAQVKDLQAQITEAQVKAAEAAKKAEEDRIKSLQNVHKSILDKYKTYYSVSAKAEMQYWDIARKQFAEGTDARIEADQEYFNARDEYYDNLAELDEEYAEKKQDIDDDLAKSIKDLQDAYDDTVKSREQEIKSSMNLFEAWDAEGWDSDKLVANLKTQVEGIRFWERQLENLSKKNVTAGLLEELAAMGPEAAANLWSLNQMTAEQLEEYNRLWEEKNNLAHKQALKDNENLLKETQDAIEKARRTAQDEMAKMDQDYRRAVQDLNTDLSEGLGTLVSSAEDIGEEMVSALIGSLTKDSNKTSITNAIATLQQQIQQEAERQQQIQQEAAQPQAAAEQAAAEAAAVAAQAQAIMAAIQTGTKHKKKLSEEEKSSHVALWEYLVVNYGYAPSNNTYKQLGAALGLPVSKEPTKEEKKALLQELKRRGYATGARNIWQDELANWLENNQTEYLLRKSDGAIVQPMRKGDKIVNPQGAENLYSFAEDPTKFIADRAQAALAMAQEAVQRRQDEMRAQIPELSYGGITRLNRLMEQGAQAPIVNVDNRDLVPLMQQMVSGMQMIMGQMQELQDRQIVMDTGALVGELRQPMSQANAAAQIRRNRGRLR